MSEMKSLTLNDKTYDGFVDPVARELAAASAVVKPASGESVTLSDSGENKLYGLNIYGKTTQDGTPAPDAPIDLVSSVDGNSISIHVCGKNLFTGWITGSIDADTGADTTSPGRRTEYLPVCAPMQKITVSGLPDSLYNMFAFYDTDKKFIGRSSGTVASLRTEEATEGAKYFRFTVYENPTTSGTTAEVDAMANVTMIEVGSTATEYERAERIQTATISTPNGLRGIPVTSGGNYTDANGQQWVCDYVDLARGKYVQNVGLLDFSNMVWYWDETYDIWRSQDFSDGKGRTPLLCETIPYVLLSLGEGTLTGTFINAPYNIWVRNGSTEITPSGKAYYQMDTAIETALSAEEIAAYNALRTHRGHTTVSNDGHAYMELEYAMDAKKYIDSIVAGPVSRLASVSLPASKWTGSNSLYSQVVTIPGITEYSKVDLLPSVEQLAIFFNKNVSFVTENEDGVVTVYAIGDKPTLDYTMQISITEVVA